MAEINRPKLSMMPSVADLAAIECPFERAAAITAVARTCGMFTRPYSDLRLAALLHLRTLVDRETGKRYKVVDIARRVGMSPDRISQLTAAVVATATAQ